MVSPVLELSLVLVPPELLELPEPSLVGSVGSVAPLELLGLQAREKLE